MSSEEKDFVLNLVTKIEQANFYASLTTSQIKIEPYDVFNRALEMLKEARKRKFFEKKPL